MKSQRKKEKTQNTIKEIFKDHWETFCKSLSHRIPKDMWESVEEAVEKMLKCGDPKNGYAKYLCLDCYEEKVVAFTCKSRFCNRCGKVYIDNWVEKQVEKIIDVGHRHAVFSIPEELRRYFYWNRELLKELSDRVAGVIQYWYQNKSKKRDYQVGIITVVHTFGRDLQFNPHIHALVTEGALDKYKNWKAAGYIPYEYLRKSWQKLLLDLIKEKYGHKAEVRKLINRLYRKYRKGFYVHAATRMRDAKGAAKYIGRYLARPAIAEYRIINYDGKNVRFWYKDHKTGKRMEVEMEALDFIGRLTMHIPKKGFRMVRRYGLYRRDLNKLAQQVVELHNFIKTKNKRALLERKKHKQKQKRYKDRMKESFGTNPLKCPHCGKEMELWRIWHPKYGYIYVFERDGMEEIGDGRDTVPRERTSRILQLSLQEM